MKDVDSFTVSELLRLLLLPLPACDRGLLNKLRTISVFDLAPEEKLQLVRVSFIHFQ